MSQRREHETSWETESGLIDDVDGWVINPHFGFKEEYAQAVLQTSGTQGGAMFIVDLEDGNGEIIGSQGWSIGSGWEISDDGMAISHPKRKNVVHSSLYGQLQNIVTKELEVPMDQYGIPTDARSWDRLGFHWMLKTHDTVSGKPAPGLMPTQFLGKKGGAKAVPTAGAATQPTRAATGRVSQHEPGMSVAELELVKLIKSVGSVKEFQLKALRIPAVVNDDALMARVLDDGPGGFYALNKS